MWHVIINDCFFHYYLLSSIFAKCKLYVVSSSVFTIQRGQDKKVEKEIGGQGDKETMGQGDKLKKGKGDKEKR